MPRAATKALVVGLDTTVQLLNASFPNWVFQGRIIAYDTLGSSTDSIFPYLMALLRFVGLLTLEQPVVEAKARVEDALPIFSHERPWCDFIQFDDMNNSCAMIGTDRCPWKRRLHISVHAGSHPRPQATGFLQQGGYRGLKIKDGSNSHGKVGYYLPRPALGHVP